VGLTPTIETKLESGIYVPNRLAERADPMLGLDQWAQFFDFGGLAYPFWPRQTLLGQRQEWPDYTFEGYVQGIYKANGPIFTCMLVRMLIFSEARFQFRQLNNGRPGELFGTKDLQVLETPWPNGTTGDLLARAIQDADLAGNAFFTRQGGSLNRLRPDWMTIVAGSPREDPGDVKADPFNYAMDTQVIGYMYQPGGPASSRDPVVLLPEEVCHFAPIPDPVYRFRGMSWLTPVIREVLADNAATSHKLKFFEHGATVNMVISLNPSIQEESFRKWIKDFEEQHRGTLNAYKTLYLGGGATVTPVGATPEQIDFKVTQGAGEPLALDTPIPTPSGWTTMGEIAVGDEVFDRDGHAVRVTGISPIRVGRSCYRVTFSDRTAIIADASHLWAAMDRNTATRAERTYTTEELAALIADWRDTGHAGNRMGIPAGRPVELPARDLLIDPYVLGVWLGDGQTAGAAVCGAEDDLSLIAAEVERRGYTVTRWATKPGKVSVIGLPGGLLGALDALGVLGDKRIPAEYLRASAEQRLDLLRGLMDTDGSVGHVGKETCEYSSKLESLGRQVAELARSLGYRATLGRKEEPRSRTGETWRVTFRADPDVVPFLLPRKAERCQTPVWVKNRAIILIEPVESVPVRCIVVDSPDHLFRAGDGWTLTHNTRIANAAGVPPVVAGFAEGLASATYSNYREAREHFADATLRPLWRNFAGSMQTLVPPPHGSAMLWYDDRDIAFLRADRKDIATIQQTQAATISSLVNAGYKPETVIKAILAEDWALLEHTGLYSVQLQPPMPKGISASANGKDVAPVPVQS
jgi:hypothetical protein